MSLPKDFPQSNKMLTCPPPCLPLPVYDDGNVLWSCWELDEDELQKINDFGCVFVGVHHQGTGTSPPLSVKAPEPHNHNLVE